MRILTYNVHGSVNSQRQTNPATIAEIIGGIGADYIALQEVDAEKPFTKNVNKARIIGELIATWHIPFDQHPFERLQIGTDDTAKIFILLAWLVGVAFQ